MPSIRGASLVIHTTIIVMFLYYHSIEYYPMLLAPLCHLLFFLNDSACYQNHCDPPSAEAQSCEMCGLPRWMRMRHCYKCERCVHKYDHHCFLMGSCVGEFNHKYYIAFLYLYTINTVVLLLEMQDIVEQGVTLDKASGVQVVEEWFYAAAAVMVGLYFNLFLGLFLSTMHSYLLINNSTTWELHKRDTIHYLKNIDPAELPYPFSQGVLHNLKQCFEADKSNPIKWKI